MKENYYKTIDRFLHDKEGVQFIYISSNFAASLFLRPLPLYKTVCEDALICRGRLGLRP